MYNRIFVTLARQDDDDEENYEKNASFRAAYFHDGTVVGNHVSASKRPRGETRLKHVAARL
jgi:hypothetical protein